jgi:RNA polymerase sigma-70 factor (ECF subfamily)
MTASADFRELYDTHFRMVWRVLRRLGVPSADVLDLTQKVFLVAFTKMPAFEGRSTMSTWLCGICNRVAWAHRRSMATRNEISTDPASLEEAGELDIAPLDLTLARHNEAERILAKLSEGQRAVFVLYEVDELSGPEIASLLNISLGTVRSRLRYARATFRREVQRLALQKSLPIENG